MGRVEGTVVNRVSSMLEHFGLSVDEFWRNIKRTPGFYRDLRDFRSAQAESSMPVERLIPMLTDVDEEAGVTGGHYFHQDLWAARKIFHRRPARHFDVGSSIAGFIAHVLVFMDVHMIDIRPLSADVEGLQFIQADATDLAPIKDQTMDSVSSLHAAEHFGLGRYGDSIDPDGHLKFMSNLQRVLQPGGRLYFSVPVGRERIEFNAHRVLSPETVLNAFDGLELVSLDGVVDGRYRESPDLDELEGEEFACGLFEFSK